MAVLDDADKREWDIALRYLCIAANKTDITKDLFDIVELIKDNNNMLTDRTERAAYVTAQGG